MLTRLNGKRGRAEKNYVSDIPQHRELPLPEFRYFPKEDVERLARAMDELFQRGISPKECRRYLDLLQRDYNWDRIAERTLWVYREVQGFRIS